MLSDPAAARLRAYQLMEGAQEDGRATAAAELASLEDEATAHGWDEAAFAAAAGRVLTGVLAGAGREVVDAGVEALVHRGQRLGAPELLALALALRALVSAGRGDGEQLLTDAGRAVVLQDDPSRPSLDRCMVLAVCAGAYNTLRLWELVDELYDQASALAAECEVPVHAPAIAVSRVLVRLEWAAALLEVDREDQAVVQLVRTAQAAEAAERVDGMPPLFAATAHACRDVAAFIRQAIAWSDGDDDDGGRRRDTSWVPEGLERLDEHRARLVEAGDVELGPLFDALVSLALLRCGRGTEAARRLQHLAFSSASSGAVSFPLWVRAEVETAAGPGAGAPAQREYATLVSRLRWTARQGLLDAARSRITAERLGAENAVLARDVLLDPLTGLSNRRAFDAWLTGDHPGSPAAALVLVDLDDFKAVNDAHGHAVGDEVLRRVGRLLAGHVRPGDLALRLGGDEFAVVLQDRPGGDTAQGVSLDVFEGIAIGRADDLVAAVIATDWSRVVPGLDVQVSVGLAVARLDKGDPWAADLLYRTADANLYESKGHRGTDAGESGRRAG
jgi:diguanylate cyclase (GGDEF)-like protein